MRKGTFVGAIVLTIGVVSAGAAMPALAQDFTDSMQDAQVANHAGPIIRESHISRLRAALNLTASQHPLWVPVEAALRDIARSQSRDVAGVGFVQRMSDRATSAAGDAMRLRRLAMAARPLIRVLDDNQKHDAMMLAQRYGFDRLVSAF